MKKNDPKYLGIPNINFSLTDKKDEREKKYRKQRLIRGFDSSELWSLDCTIANFILPRLEAFQYQYEQKTVDDSHMISDINKMIMAFELVVRDNGNRDWTNKETKQYEKGIRLFSKRFLDLWT